MIKTLRLAGLSAAAVLLAGAASAQNANTGGAAPGTTNGMSSSMSTGAATGSEASPSVQLKNSVGTGDDAVLNAPGEKTPGSMSKSQPSNLNGQ